MKRIIDLDEIIIGETKYYKVRGCKTMFFDQWGFDNLTKELKVKEEDQPLLNCKFVVTRSLNPSFMTVGKIYSVQNGKFETDIFESFPICSFLHTVEELENYFVDDFDNGETDIAVLRY